MTSFSELVIEIQYTFSKGCKWKSEEISVDKDLEQLEISYTAGDSEISTATLEKNVQQYLVNLSISMLYEP